MNRPSHLFAALALAAVLVPGAGLAGPDPSADAAERSEDYRAGQRALDREDWDEAAEIFAWIAQNQASETDAALYWHAYAQLKRGRKSAALASLRRLYKDHPQSSWIDDAKALEVEAARARGREPRPEIGEDEEMKLYILSSLIHVDAERALPVLERLLAGDQSERVKERALFVLSQSDSPRAAAIVAQAAKGGSGPRLATKAVEYLALYGAEEAAPLLEEIYATSGDLAIRRKVLEMLMVSGDEERLFRAAREEPDLALRRMAIEQLGIMGAADRLRQLYDAEPAIELRRRIVEALFLADRADLLEEIARSDADPSIRRQAIESLGLMGDESGPVLRSLYGKEPSPDIRRYIIEAFFLQDDHEALIEIVRTEKEPVLRRRALEQLSIMGSDEATDFLLRMLEEEGG